MSAYTIRTEITLGTLYLTNHFVAGSIAAAITTAVNTTNTKSFIKNKNATSKTNSIVVMIVLELILIVSSFGGSIPIVSGCEHKMSLPDIIVYKYRLNNILHNVIYPICVRGHYRDSLDV